MKSAKPPKAGKKPAKKRSASKSTAARSAPSKAKKSRISVSLLHHMPMNVSILFLNRINKFTAQGGDPDDTLKKTLKELKSCFSKGDTPADRSVVVSLINRLHVAVFVPRRISMQTSVMSFGDPSLATSSQPPAIRKLKSVMKKSTDLFPAIVSCLKEESCQADEVITAYILSFLYNIVIALPQAQQIKATKACEKLGVLRILSAILRRHQTSVEDTVPNLYALRICEGCSLLMAFFGVFNSKVMLLLRLSKDLTVVRDFVEKMASKHLSGIVSSLNKGGPFQTKQTSDEELFILRVFLNLSISLFALSKGPQNAQELGVKTASLSARNITTLFQVLATKDSVEAEDVNHKGILICQLLQSTVFWQVALFHRITSCVVIRSQCCQEANELNLVTPLYRIFSESCTSDGSLPPNRLPRFNAQFTHLILLSLTELLLGDRGKTLEYLSTVGGLSAVVECVLKIDETKPTVWQQFLSRLSAMYGVSLLPAQPEKSALQLDGRRAPTGDGASHDQLLHVDVSPESFSPELSTDAVRFALPPLADIVLPRQCEIDAPAPMPSGDGDAAESGDREPLLAPTAETKVEVLNIKSEDYRH
ncbi:hypothetical protein AGDE_15668 [Angomonas deanei]|uniref:Uncharacterized protein n=1 Tax=Angomonas deanei TaxID=59799 RepID=A0A7G2CDD1_9TRYP|nr:hypothetical protein AGDE_15668 [Angomonas deanei]CAD2217848.1 hypothetical protein, conserved [Angomonas deanei]|eukprot:EPY18700.1 hypothetical protein AGDE_15668 [Angomonas deanei]